jgi:hypothetical protein
MTTLVCLAILLLGIVAGGLWLSKPMHDDDFHPRHGGEFGPAGGSSGPPESKLLASMSRHPSALPAPAPSPAQPTPHLHTQARIVFATLRDGTLLLDCVVADSPPDTLRPNTPLPNTVQVAAGLPITLSLGEVGTPWLAAHVEAMLERWAEGERVIDLELRDSPLGPRATLVSASSRLVLPLTTVAGLS